MNHETFALPNFKIGSYAMEGLDETLQLRILYADFMMLQAVIEYLTKASYCSYLSFQEIPLNAINPDNEGLIVLKNVYQEKLSKYAKQPLTAIISQIIKLDDPKQIVTGDKFAFKKSLEALAGFRNSLAHIKGDQRFNLALTDDSNLVLSAILCTNHTWSKRHIIDKIKTHIGIMCDVIEQLNLSLYKIFSSIADSILSVENNQIIAYIKASEEDDLKNLTQMLNNAKPKFKYNQLHQLYKCKINFA